MNDHAASRPDAPAPCDLSSSTLLVLTQIFAKDRNAGRRILLIKRGIEPYSGKWAPPGGFVEHGESPESAAIREVREEAQIDLDPRLLLPHAVIALPAMNQTYHVFVACLSEMLPARAMPPESLDVGWFTKEDLVRIEMWGPDAVLNTALLFERLPGP